MPIKRKNDPGYKLPEVIEPDENCCICIPIPNDFNHKMAFLGQLDELGYWWNWERDTDKKGREAAAVWRKIVACIREDLSMSDCGCGSSNPTNTRINPTTGLYEVSYDGGVTREPDPGSDPRSSGTLFPPVAGDPGDELRCTGANSALGYLQEIQAAELEGLQNNASIADFITMLTGFLGAVGIFFAFVPGAIAALLSFVVNFFGHKIALDFENAFTETLWDELFCILYCHIEDDGSYTEAGWQAVKNDLDNDISNYGLGWMYNHINLIGTVGLTNAARASYTGTRPCDECECAGCADKYVIGLVGSEAGHGLIVDRTATTIDVQAQNPGNNVGYIILQAEITGSCCYLNTIEALDGGTIASQFHINCGTVPTEGAWINGESVGGCRQAIQVQTQVGKIFRFTFDECP